MKRIWIIVLSFLLLYGGVAWAFEACLQGDHHSNHATSGHHSDSPIPVGHDDSRDPSLPMIHCAPLSHQASPAVKAVSPEIPRSDKVVPLDIASLPSALSAVLSNDFWLEALFKRTVAFSLPIDLARHLFLSVLQI